MFAIGRLSRRRAANLVIQCAQQPHRHRSSEAWNELGSLPAETLQVIDGRLHKIREHNGRPLPVPPMLDDAYMSARMKHKAAKEERDWQQRTPFQFDLERNPFAKALTSPLRRCVITELRLPTALLQPFTIHYEGAGTRSDTSRVGVVAKAATQGEDRLETSLSRYTYVSLDKRVLASLSRRTIRIQLVDRLHVERLEARICRALVREKLEVTLVPKDVVGTVSAMLTLKVQKVVNMVVRNEKPLCAGGQRLGLDDIKLLVTFGAEYSQMVLMPNGVIHYMWTGMPSCESMRLRLASSGCSTIGVLPTERSAKLGVAFNRLLAYVRADDLPPAEQVMHHAQAAYEQWKSSLVNSVGVV